MVECFRKLALDCLPHKKMFVKIVLPTLALPTWWVQGDDDLSHHFWSYEVAGVNSEVNKRSSLTSQEGILPPKRVAACLLLHFNL